MYNAVGIDVSKGRHHRSPAARRRHCQKPALMFSHFPILKELSIIWLAEGDTKDCNGVYWQIP